MNDSLIYVWLIGQPPKLSTFRANRKVLPSLIGQTPWPEFLFRTSGFTKESFKSGLLTLTITLENPASWDDGKPFSWRVPKIWQYYDIFRSIFFRFWVLPPKEYLQINQAKKFFVFGNLPFLLLQSRPSLLSNLAPTNLPNSNWPIATEEMATIDDSLKICKQL